MQIDCLEEPPIQEGSCVGVSLQDSPNVIRPIVVQWLVRYNESINKFMDV